MTNKDSPRPTTSVAQVILDSVDDMAAQLFDRLDGLGVDEYLWEPAPGAWNVRPSESGPVVDFDPDRDIDPAPVTTIAWRLWHLAADCFVPYTERFAGNVSDDDLAWTMDPNEAIGRLHSSWADFRALLAGIDDWFAELGEHFGPWRRHCVADFAMHASNELVHHGAEIATLRDLYRSAGPDGWVRER